MGTITILKPEDSGPGPRRDEGSAARCGRALAVVLFLDIVDSTHHTIRLGDRGWRQVLDAYEARVDVEAARHGGCVVKSTGDGSLVLLPSAGPAIRCAQAIARAVADLGIELRCGLHCGEVEMRGADVAGVAVAIAHRVQAAARPGEVLVSRTVADVVRGDDVVLVDRGEHPLKGIPGAWQLFTAIEQEEA